MNPLNVVDAYRELERASLSLQEALVRGNSQAVVAATKKLASARNVIAALVDELPLLSPEEQGELRATALKISHINRANELLSKRRLAHIRIIRKSLSDCLDTGYDSEGTSVIDIKSKGTINDLV